MMIELTSIFSGIIERGLIFTLPVIAVYLSSRVISFDDLTMEGSFGLGSAVTAFCLLHAIPWYGTIPLAMAAGGICGIITALLHTQLSINKLISGIITTTGVFSVTLALAGSFLSLSDAPTIFDSTSVQSPIIQHSIILLPIVLMIIVLISWFLVTQVGLLLRALGTNPHMLTVLGKSTTHYTVSCLALSNALTALSGSLFVQYAGYFSIWMQVGILILALAGLMLSEIIWTTFGIGIILGPIVYQALTALTFELQLDPSWNKLVTALLMIILFSVQKLVNTSK